MQPSTVESLVRTHHACVFGAAWRVLRDGAAAEDVVQEVFLRVVDGRLDLAGAEEPAGVLALAATRVALSRGRSETARRRREERYAMQDERTPERPARRLEQAEERALVYEALAALPDAQQAALVLRFQEGLTFTAVGRALGVSEPSAMERVQKALDALGRRLRAFGGAALAAALVADEGHALGRLVATEAPAPRPGLAEELVRTLASSGAGVPAGAGAGGLLVPGVVMTAVAALALGVGLDRGADADPRAAAVVAGPGAVVSAHADAAPSGEASPSAERVAAPAIQDHDADRSDADGDPAVLRVQVRDADGAPVLDAHVRAFVRAPGLKFPSEDVGARTDGRGFARLELPVDTLPEALRGEPWALLVDHPAAPRASTTVGDLAPGEERALAFELEASAAAVAFEIDVRVVDRDGPVAGASVALGHVVGDPASVGTLRVEDEATLTGPDGRLTLRGQWLGDKRVVVDGRPVGRTHELVSLRVQGSGLHALEVTCSAAWRVAGVARAAGPDSTEGLGLTLYPDEDGWRRRYVHPWWDEPPSATVDAAGRFRLFADPPDDGTLWLGLPRWSTSGWSPFALAITAPTDVLEPLLKREDDPRDVGLHLAELHGELVFPQDERPPWWPARWVEVVPVPDDVRGAAELADFLAATQLGDAGPAGPAPQRAAQQMEAPRRLVPGDPEAADEVQTFDFQVDGGPAEEPQPHTFHRVGLRPGRQLLVARVRGYAPLVAGPFELGAEAVIRDVRLELVHGRTVEGVVVDADGRPVEGALVTLAGPGARGDARVERLAAFAVEHPRARAYGALLSARTEADGAFTLVAVPPGDALRLAAAHADGGVGTAVLDGAHRVTLAR